MKNKFCSAPWIHDMDFHLYQTDTYSLIRAGDGYPPNGFTLTGVMNDSEAKLIASSPELYEIITKCQDILATWIVPDSNMTDKECLNNLLDLLDNEKLVKLLRTIN